MGNVETFLNSLHLSTYTYKQIGYLMNLIQFNEYVLHWVSLKRVTLLRTPNYREHMFFSQKNTSD